MNLRELEKILREEAFEPLAYELPSTRPTVFGYALRPSEHAWRIFWDKRSDENFVAEFSSEEDA